MRRAIVVCTLASALAGCGGGSGGAAGSSAARPAATATRTEVVTTVSRGGRSFIPERIYKERSPGVVTVVSLSGAATANALGRGQEALGSGFVVDGTGYIATNAHVVENDSGSEAKAVYVDFADGNQLPARIVGTDDNSDIALLKIDPSRLRPPGTALVTVPLGSTARLSVGDPVAAIGSPFGEQQSLTVGVVSATGRDIESLTRFPIGNAIQTDAAINHGNSGGPLLDARGKVVGVNSQIRSTGGGGEGVGFAIPVETVKRSIAQLRAKGHVDYAYLGISSVTLYPQLAERLRLPVTSGALIDEVKPSSPAQKAGLRGAHGHIGFQGVSGVPVGGDVIVSVGGRRLGGALDLSDLVARYDPGHTVDFVVIRNGQRRTLRVTFGTRPRTSSG
jgi:S1-C subfamily serine protease